MPLNVYGTALEWLEYARNDLESADYLTNKKPLPLEIICYHCHQCAEKALKSFLIYSNCDFAKTHDTSLLCAECNKINDSFKTLLLECASLKNYSVTSRYPYPIQIEEQDMKKALLDAKKVFEFIERLIKQN